jgi:hypothetical protein
MQFGGNSADSSDKNANFHLTSFGISGYIRPANFYGF